MQCAINGGVLELVQGNIVDQAVDAVVNAANPSLLGGGGVDGAIHRAAGPQLLAKCATLGGCRTGEAKLTPGYRLPARAVIHTVGPVYKDGQHGEAELLARAYQSSLALASQHGLARLALPSISTGVYGYPLAEAAHIALSTVVSYLQTHPEIALVRFVLWGSDSFATYCRVLAELCPGT